ncbi:MAG: GFA family protein [Betaproteobacteria bacterium]|nr:GFA family protein [Betaproteobacteria bacterium]
MTTSELPAEGGCACGAVRYHMTTRPLFVNCCHCRWCQRETGSAFVINAMIESDHLEVLQGETELIDTPSQSGKGQLIARCPACHVALWSHYAGSGRRVSFVRVGTLDHPDRFPPGAHVFTMSKQPWLNLEGGAPVFEEYYEREKLWPAESLRRREALLASK